MPPRTTPSKQHKVQPNKSRSSDNKRKPKSNAINETLKPSYPLSREPQQAILSHYTSALSLTPASLPDLQKTIQSVKSVLYARDFASAFGTEEFLHAYSARWSPSRSLGYAQLLLQENESLSASNHESTNVVCLGGGAGAELIGMAVGWGVIQQRQPIQSARLRLDLVDSAAWEPVLDALGCNIQSLVPDGCEVEYAFHRSDVLAPSAAGILLPLLEKADLVTLLFTLNELYAAGMGATTRFLLELGEVLKPGARLCVADSAGSYAGIMFGQEDSNEQNQNEEHASKRYPMAWMLDHTLLELDAKNKQDAKWRKIMADESRWFRRDKTLEYPLQLEDMRYQLHVFERLGK